MVLRHTLPDFPAELQEARKVLQRQAGKKFLPQNVESETLVGFSVERLWTFYKPDKFEKMFGAKAEAVGLATESISVDVNKMERGVLVLDDDNIKVRSFHLTQVGLHGLIFDNSKQLRAEQGSDIWKHAGSQQAVPKPFTKLDMALTAQKIQDKVREIEEKKRKEAEELRAAEAALPQAPQGMEQDGEEDGSSEDEESEEEVIEAAAAQEAVLYLPPSTTSKKRKKPNADAADTRRRVSSRSSDLEFDAFTDAGLPSSASSAGGSSSGKRRSQIMKAMDKAREWIGKLPWSDILNDKPCEKGSWGKLLWQATATQESLQKLSRGCAEAVHLQNHLEIARLCEARQK